MRLDMYPNQGPFSLASALPADGFEGSLDSPKYW